jgi:hypothetical protein
MMPAISLTGKLATNRCRMARLQVGYAVRTFCDINGTHSVPYEAVHQRLPVPLQMGWLKQHLTRKEGALNFLSRTQVKEVIYGAFRMACRSESRSRTTL